MVCSRVARERGEWCYENGQVVVNGRWQEGRQGREVGRVAVVCGGCGVPVLSNYNNHAMRRQPETSRVLSRRPSDPIVQVCR